MLTVPLTVSNDSPNGSAKGALESVGLGMGNDVCRARRQGTQVRMPPALIVRRFRSDSGENPVSHLTPPRPEGAITE